VCPFAVVDRRCVREASGAACRVHIAEGGSETRPYHERGDGRQGAMVKKKLRLLPSCTVHMFFSSLEKLFI
jgi:hypothetical protein